MTNLLRQFRDLIPAEPLLAGEVLSITNGIATVELPDASRVTARGSAGVGQKVFLRAGKIEGPAPDLPVITLWI